MPYRRFALLLLAALPLAVFACDDGDQRTPPPVEEGGSGGGGGEVPTHPLFDGVTSVTNDPQDANSVIVRWGEATDDVTSPEALVTTLWVANDHPLRGAPGSLVDYDVSGLREYRYSGLPGEEVRWFQVVVTDADGESAGEEKVLAGVRPTVAPVLAEPVPLEAGVGEEVQLRGDHLLDEPTIDEAVSVGGVIVPLSDVVQWSNQLLTFRVPAGAVSGPVTVTTPFGTASSTVPLQVR